MDNKNNKNWSFYSEQELKKLGLKEMGRNVFISKLARLYSPEKIKIGSNVRIDDFCILSGNISIGDSVHISASSLLFAGDSFINIGNHVSISSRCAIYAISDDFNGNYLIGSMEDETKRHVLRKNIKIDDFSAIGTGTTLLPGSSIGEGACVGAMSLVKGMVTPWTINCGIPCKYLKKRNKERIIKLLEL